MERLSMTTTTYNITQYARCEIEEIQLLEKHKVSGTATRVYLVLRSLSRESDTCFPSLKTIAKVLDITSKSAIQIVCNALAKLVRCGLVVRNHFKSKQRFYLKAKAELPKNSIKRKRETDVNENVYRTETKNKSYFNKQKKNNNIKYNKGTKTAYNNGLNKTGRFDGGINETYTESDLHPSESAFSKAIDQRTPLTPNQVSMFQSRMEESRSFRLFVMAFHPPMFQRIMGVRLTDDEVLYAHKQWTNENVSPILNTSMVASSHYTPKSRYPKPIQNVFDKLLSQMKM
jgi:hypothetical protein